MRLKQIRFSINLTQFNNNQLDSTTIQLDSTTIQFDSTTIQLESTTIQLDSTTIQLDSTTIDKYKIERAPTSLISMILFSSRSQFIMSAAGPKLLPFSRKSRLQEYMYTNHKQTLANSWVRRLYWNCCWNK